ncbi:E3 ubiquitin-protein ligase MARCH6, partial [Phenoliferia sp. Uapishka_3]
MLIWWVDSRNLLIALCLGGAVWIPLCLGRVLAAVRLSQPDGLGSPSKPVDQLQSDAIRFFTLPLRAVRSLSDPVFDFIFSLLSFIPLLLISYFAPTSSPSSTTASNSITTTLAQNATTVLSSTSSTSSIPSTRPLQKAFQTISKHWTSMAFDDDPLHRALCVALGYAAVAFAGFVYLQSTKGVYGQSVNRAIRDGLKQQLVLLKVVLFVFIEIIIFPGTCGLILNLATLPLFPEATVWTRAATYAASPVSTGFLTWLAGTAFMFSFSTSIDHVRDVVRHGVLFFIRDPATQDFHPIREILERNSGTQAKKIAISALLYGGAIFLTIGSSVYFLRYAVGILPLHWTQARPFSLPIDLVIYRFVIPFTLNLVDPGTRIKSLFTHWAKLTASQLRLTSFIFSGKRHPEEEGTQVRRTWRAVLLLKKANITDAEEDDAEVSKREVYFRKDGGFGRVPAIDTIRVAQGRQMIVRVTEEGHPLDGAGAGVVAQQLLEMTTTRATDKYEVVYLPPHFKTRIALFVYLLWFTGSLAGMSMVVVPLVLGRYLFSLVSSTPVHDLYALVTGIYVVSILSFAVRQITTMRFVLPTRQHLSAIRASVTACLVAGVVLPLLLAIFLSAYIILPFSRPSKTAGEPDFPTIHLLESWAVGTMAVSAIHSFITLPFRRPRVRFDEAIIEAWNNGNRTLAFDLVTKAATWRMSLLFFGAFAPGVGAALAWWNHSTTLLAAGWTYYHICRLAYRIAIVGFGILALAQPASKLATKWAGGLREAEYLVERRLRNFDDVQRASG